MTGFPSSDKITTAVVTGRHPFDVPAFYAMMRSLKGVDFYVQHMEDFASDAGQVRTDYDVVLFYNFHIETPTDEGPWYEKATRQALDQLGQTKQGIFILHHAVLAFPQWEFWADLVGIRDREFTFHIGEKVRVEIADPEHPIGQGLEPWEMVDETYLMKSAGEDSRAVLSVDHPKSMKVVGWTRTFGQSRVFCLQLGHDGTAFSNESFRKVIERGIQWCAGKI